MRNHALQPARNLSWRGRSGFLGTVFLASVTISACSSSSTPNSTAGSSAAGPSPTSVATLRGTDPPFNSDTTTGVGVTFPITYPLPGDQVGTLQATLKAVADPADTPAAPGGARYVACEFSILNQAPATPATAFDFLKSMTLIAEGGGISQALPDVHLTTGSMIAPGSALLAGGATLTGWAVFAVKGAAVARLLNLAPEGPTGNQTSWDIRPHPSAPTPTPPN